jgi:GTP-binding protein EngB required for normal cell division
MSEPSDIQEIARQIRRRIEETKDLKIRIALLGRSGAGKSSLINALTGKEIAEVGIHTNTTTKKEFYEWNNLILVDLPGFDTEQFPRDTFYKDFDLDQFDLFLCVFEGKISEADALLFRKAIDSGKPYQFVRSKWDSAKQKGHTKEELAAQVREDLAVQFTTSLPVSFVSVDPPEGLNELQNTISDKLPAAKGKLWIERAKAYSKDFLDKKKEECRKTVTLYAGLSAATGLLPVPGVGVAVDVGALLMLFDVLRKSFGIHHVNPKEMSVPVLAQAANRIIDYATKEGALLLLKRFAGTELVKEVGKYVPIVGQVLAASAGFAITKAAGNAYLDDCYKLAEAALDGHLDLGE